MKGYRYEVGLGTTFDGEGKLLDMSDGELRTAARVAAVTHGLSGYSLSFNAEGVWQESPSVQVVERGMSITIYGTESDGYRVARFAEQLRQQLRQSAVLVAALPAEFTIGAAPELLLEPHAA